MKSLLFTSKKTEKTMQSDLISDLKLDLLFPPEVCNFLLYKSGKNDIISRHEMFSKMLADENSEKIIEKMLFLLNHAHALYKSLNSAPSESTETYIFPSLFKTYAEFAEIAANLGDYGENFREFTDYFKGITGENRFKKAKSDLVSVLENLENFRYVYIKTDGNSSKVQKSVTDDMTVNLIACAKELGIEITERNYQSFTLQKSVSESFSKLCPDEFNVANDFYLTYRTLISGEIFSYTEELAFIHGILLFAKEAKSHNIPLSFPKVSETKKIDLKNVYDVTLLRKEGTIIVPNDVEFTENEPFFYLTGANGGGKTTYLRATGTALILFISGAPVPCESGECYIPDGVFTHFPRDERFEGSGRFFDEIKRVEEILDASTENSVILLNETYATTGEEKALEYTADLAKKLYERGNFGLYITHQHELSGVSVPFLGVMIDENDSNRRTYRIEKRRLPPRSFAKDILEKYRLTPDALRQRFGLDKK